MKTRKPRLCVVDDDPDEIRRFRANMATRFIVGGGTSLNAALEDLRRQGHSSPDLYVLDLYFPQSGSSTQEQLQELAKARKEVLDSQAEFASLLARLGQTTQGGFRLADRLSRFGRRAPFVFFSRKATVEDVVQALDFGALRVIKKPDPTATEMTTGHLPSAYDKALARAAHDVARDIEDAISRSTFWWKHREAVIAFFLGLMSSSVAGVLLLGFSCRR